MTDTAINRRWLQFSLRGLLAALTITAIALGACVRSVARQKQAMSVIREAGGMVIYDWMETALRTMSSAAQPAEPKWLRKLLGEDYFHRPVWIQFWGSAKSDRWVDAVNDLPSVKYLLLAQGDVTDEILSRISRLPKLEELHLSGSAITDRGFRQLHKFPRLRWLTADGTQISDRAVNELNGMKLEWLVLRETLASDACVPSLIAMTNLQMLDLRSTQVTEAGAARIRRALPNCEVLR
jgi:hypothetical protein